MSIRIIAAGAAMLAGLSLATTPARACDDRFGAACTPPAPAAAAAEPAAPVAAQPTTRARTAKPRRVAKAQPEPAKAHRGKRSRLALTRHRKRPAAEPTDEMPESVAAPVAEVSPRAPQDTPAARRFREFLSPQSFAVAAGETLRTPRLLAAHFSNAMAAPEIGAAALTAPVESTPHQDTTAIIAHDQAVGDDSPSTAPVLSHSDAATTEVRVGRASGNEPTPRMSFVSWFFVAWGGVLTFASAVRMAVG
jgi:hypothetical protein